MIRRRITVASVLATVLAVGAFKVGTDLLAKSRVRDFVARHDGHLCKGFPGRFSFDCVDLSDTTIDGESMKSLVCDLQGLSVKYLCLIGTTMDDAALHELGELTEVRSLGLGGAGFSDASMAALRLPRGLVGLRLEDATVTDAALPALAAASELKTVFLYTGGLSKSAVDELRSRMPETRLDTATLR